MAERRPTSRLGQGAVIRRAGLLALQLTMVVVFLAAWQFLPQIPSLSASSHLLDPFFISSPARVFERIRDVTTGQHKSFVVWPYLSVTLLAALQGTAVGMVLGAFFGMLLSSSRFLSDLVRPFVVGLNAVPRIALIPIIILLVGPTFAASVVIVVLVVFFVAFFNAYEGGTTVAPQLLQNSQILGANRWQLMWRIRLPYVLAWTLAALPLAATFAIISVVTAEILTGYPGMGRLIDLAASTADASLTFGIVVILSAVGIATVGVAEVIKRRILHWWGTG
jgi:NitT/TauT family transport system permease protein